MSKEKITITEIIDLMNGKNNFSKKQSEEFVKMLLSTIEDALIEGESVKIKDLGTFKPQWNEPRKSVDVNTGDEIIIPGFYKVVFTPDNEFKELVNKPYAHLKPVEQSSVVEKEVSEEKTPESIIASVPSSTALATSDTSALVGREFFFIDSNISVATIQNLPYSRHF